jgi:hypothetical protein
MFPEIQRFFQRFGNIFGNPGVLTRIPELLRETFEFISKEMTIYEEP